MGFGDTPAPPTNVLSHTPPLVSPADSTDGYVQLPSGNIVSAVYTKLCHVDSPNLGVGGTSLPAPPYPHGQLQTQLKPDPEEVTLWNVPLPYTPLGHIPVPIPWTHPPTAGTFDASEGNGLHSLCGSVTGFHHPHLAVGKDG